MVIVMCGLPSSGKTTEALRWVDILDNAVIIGDGATHSPEADKALVIEAILHDCDVIYDAPNVVAGDRIELVNRIHEAGDKCKCIFMDTSLVDCMVRNEKRDDSIPCGQIHLMNRKLDRPQMDEGWDAIITID